MNMISELFDWLVVFNWVVFVILLKLLVLIRIALSVLWFSCAVQGLRHFEGSVQRLDHIF